MSFDPKFSLKSCWTREEAMIRIAGSGRSVNMPPSTYSSSSTLSPLAPPFTVDRSVPAITNPSSIPPPPPSCSASSRSAYPRPKPTGAKVPYFVPSGDSVWQPSSSVATGASSRSGNLNSVVGVVEAAPYYPYYASRHDSVDDSLGKLPDYMGYAGGWSGQFDVEKGIARRVSAANSSWMDPSPSSQMSLPSHRRASAESFSAHEESFGSWHGAHNETSSVLCHVGSECSEWLDDMQLRICVDGKRALTDGPHATELDSTGWPNEGSSYFYSPETTSVVKECNKFIPNSYDRYISQLISTSRDPAVHYPAPASSSSQGYPSNEKNGSLFSCTVSKNGISVVKHVNPQKKVDDHVVGKEHEFTMCKNVEGKECLDKMGISGDALWKGSGTSYSSFLIKDLSSGNVSPRGQPIDCLQDAMSGFKDGKLSYCKASNSGVGSLILDDCIEASSETHDHLNVAVDSPCWKGASVSRGYPFGPDEIVEPLVICVTKSSDDLVQGQAVSKVQTDIKQSSTTVCSESVKDTPTIHKDLSPVIALSDSDLDLQGCIGKGRGSNPAKIENAKETVQHDIHGEYNALIQQENVSEVIGNHVRQLCQAAYTICDGRSNTGGPVPAVPSSERGANHISNSRNYPFRSKADTSSGEIIMSDAIFSNGIRKSISSNTSSRCFSKGQDTGALIKAILCLSEVLLGHNSSDNDFSEEDLKHLRKVIDNLEAFILRNGKGITGECSSVPRMEAQLELKESNADIRCNKDLKDTKENRHLMRSGLYNEKHDNIIPKSFNTNFEESDRIAQSFTRVLRSDFMEHEEDPKLLPYKKLWMQTEAALCSLRNDVALMKLEMGSFKQQFKGAAKSQTVSEGSVTEQDSHGCDEPQGPSCAATLCTANPSNLKIERNVNKNTPKEDEEASVIARYRILKGRQEADFAGSDVSQGIHASSSYVDANERGALQSHDVKKTAVVGPESLPAEKFLGPDYRIGNGLFLNDTIGAVQESQPHVPDGSLIQSYNPKNHAKWLFSSGSDSHSSEWEHVLKDEFLW